jgi:peptidoglycan/LPS O-acetylase OafA/YrhL
MRSSGGQYFERLDHLRALAAFLVFTWHFVHADQLVSDHYAPAFFPLILFDQGHIGVSLFMTLSGYLFAKLLLGKEISYRAFVWNRVLRLFPLLIVTSAVMAAWAYRQGDGDYFRRMALGFVLPTWDNGQWSIAVELHFYLVLPFILRLGGPRLVYGIAAAMLIRWLLLEATGEIHTLAYFTIFGRIDQFLAGIMAHACFRDRRIAAPWLMTGALAFFLLYWSLTTIGAVGETAPMAFQSVWIVLPTIEGAFFATLILAYEHAPLRIPGALSMALAMIGTCSYSIYLLHRLFVVIAFKEMHEHVYGGSNYYVLTGLSCIAFLGIAPIAWASFRLIEEPFLRLRLPYASARLGAIAPAPARASTAA